MASRSEDIWDGLSTGLIWGIPELFGFKPPSAAQKAMDKAPGAAMVGSLLSGTVVPYTGWYKATTKIKRLETLVERAGQIPGVTSPFLRGAAREVGRFAPLEASRIGIGVPFGDVGIGEAIANSALNLATEGLVGGLAGKLASAGQRKLRGREMIGRSAMEDPPQLQRRALDSVMASGQVPPERMPEFTYQSRDLDLLIRQERPPTKNEHIGNLIKSQDRASAEALFREGKGHETHRFLAKNRKEGGNYFETAEDYKNVLGSIGIDADKFSNFALTPRFVAFKGPKGKLDTMELLSRTGAVDVGEGWYMLDEVDGFKVMAKEVPAAPKSKLKPMPGDKISKVNQHGGLFITLTDMPDYFKPLSATRLSRAVDENAWVRRSDRIDSGNGGVLGRRAIDAYKTLPFRTTQMITQGGLKFNTVSSVSGLQPGSATIKDNKLVRQTVDYLKRVTAPTRFQLSDNPRAKLIFGMSETLKDDANAWAKELMHGELLPADGGPLGDNLLSRHAALAAGKGYKGGEFMDTYQMLPDESIKKLQDLANEAAFTPERRMHLAAEGELTELEQKFLDQAEQARIKLLNESVSSNLKFGPKKFNEYSYSFIGKSKTPLNKKQLQEKIEASVYEWTGSLSNQIIDSLFFNEMRLVTAEDAAVGKILQERIKDLQGKMRPLPAQVNQMLAPLLGKDGATKIAEEANSAMFDMTLAGVNTGYLVMNPIGVFTNVVPRAMMVINGRGLGVGSDMVYWPVPGVGTIGVVDGFRAMSQTWKDIRSPDATLRQLFDRAAKEGKLLPQIIAEGVGTDAPTKQNIMQLWNSGNYAQAMRMAWRVPAARSEQFSRLLAFTMSTNLARRAGLQNHDDIYRVTIKILDDSMYGYRQADKPAWMTGPIGGPLGLFKNWSMNFLGDTLEYAGASVRGNWRPLLWQQASVMSIAGLKASPVGLIAAGFNEMFSDNDLVQNMYDMAGEEVGGAMMYGLPMFAGLSLAPQGSAPGANPARDIQSLYEPVAYDRIKAMFLAGGEAWNRFNVTGEHPGESPELRRLIMEAIAPRTIMRTYQQFMQDDAIASSKTGYPLIKDPSIAQRVWYTMGLTTEDMQKRTAIADILYRDKERRMALTAGYGEAYKDAVEAKDIVAQQRLLRRATSDGLDPNSVARSAAARLKQGTLDQIERAGNPAYRQELLRSFGVSP